MIEIHELAGFVVELAGVGRDAADQARDAILLGFGQADPEVESERVGDLFTEVRADTLLR